ncbi:MAG TPA: hypothetical protein VNK52_05960 [Hyphomicrobiaceae bacterium]|nr:hypothetical protein [Hyphomicrobiaceae bacterium]
MTFPSSIEHAAQADDGEITPDVVSQYFTDTYRLVLLAHERWRTAIRIIQVATAIGGMVLVGLSLYLGYREAGTIGGRMIESMGRELFLLLPGLLMLVIGAVPWLWKFGWELPAGLVVLVTAAEMFFFQLGNLWFTVALFLGAIGAVVYGIYLRFKKRDPLQIADLERKLDAYTDRVMAALPQKLRLPVAVGFGDRDWLLVRSFPNGERCGALEVLCRIGSDDKPRTNPAAIAAFRLQPETLAVFEAAVDLRTHQPLYTLVQEVAYTDIAQLSWVSDVTADDARSTAGSRIAGMASAAAAAAAGSTSTGGADDQVSPRPRDRMLNQRILLEIGLPGGRTISIVFWDSAVLSRGARGLPPVPITDPSVVGALWQQILERRALTRHARSAPA